METLDWQQHEVTLHREWEAQYGGTGQHWLEIRDAHRFGWEAALREEFINKDFEEVEDDLADHWYQPLAATEEMAWDYVRDAVEEGWRQARAHLRLRSKEV